MLSRLGEGVDHQADAEQDEGDGEQLAHVHAPALYHVYFPGFLHVLDVFDEEAGQEYPYEEDAGDEPRSLFGVLFPVHPHEQAEERQVAGGFVDLRWVHGYGLAVAFEDESPRQGGGTAVDFAVHEVAEAY